MDKAIFIDKDGTLIVDVPYNINPGKIKFFPDVAISLKRLQEQGFKIIVISNQAGVSYGYFEEKDLNKVWNEISIQLQREGVIISGYYYCTHHINGTKEGFNIRCDCRKPMPGMILQAAEEHNIDLTESWMIGDILNDVEAGNSAGCKTILINNGNETEWIQSPSRNPTFMASSLLEAAIIIDNYSSEVKGIIKNEYTPVSI